MPDLTRGGNAPIAGTSLQVAVAGARQGAVDLMVFQLTDTGKVRSDADFIFFNQPASPEGAVRLTAADRLSIELAGVPAGIDKLAVAVSLDDSVPGSLAGIAGLGVTVSGPSDQHSAPAAGLTTERAAVLVEIYRRGGAWKVRNVSAGWTEGLSGLAKEHGVSVDDEPTPAPPVPTAPVATPPAPQAVPPAPAVQAPPAVAPQADGVRSVPGEAGLSLVKREKLDLRKREVAKVLMTKGAQNERARIVLVLDKTGSMADEYAAGIVHRVIERMVPVAIQLDDDGSLECYLYAVKFAKLPDIRVEYLERWMADFIHMSGVHQGINYRDIGGYNDEIPIMNEIINSLAGQQGPTLVLFFTDGGFTKKKEITNLIKKASGLPAFWQFVGIGNNNFGVLTKLDEMTGRTVDNVGFFPVTDIDRIDDGELYRRLLHEFPDWLRSARAAGILR
ncbi:Stress response protein SCP2 [Nakamurella panacisegetis]|uniref:Stress response protein SCP2 n=1 Tax=Nakamurella panacisegetis TaxID=1090615 RepID=A0A1H0MFT8_9ACTN|nr:VWA domain-containing protein [Nakamurella panacisegetis]SDO79264.1 Stress response protein SCP2 [Nakamurella panacisegetis]